MLIIKIAGERRRRSNENTANGSNGTTPPATANNIASPNNVPPSPRLSPNEWQFAFDHVIYDVDGRAQFTKFLQSEYSEENILFWWAVEELKAVGVSEGRAKFESTVQEMYDTFIAAESPLAINIDHDTRTDIIGLTASPVSYTHPPTKTWQKSCHCRRHFASTAKSVCRRQRLLPPPPQPNNRRDLCRAVSAPAHAPSSSPSTLSHRFFRFVHRSPSPAPSPS
uniref:RGS domain-containing protein n=1 Tax=Caenorhabditis japonica TaxID=281687 RepID=A0A8R1HYG2_CAEJA